MSNQRSSPYLILGVPFGAPRDEAARGFARAVKRLRRMEEPPFDLEDLNWAQHEIDHREGLADHSLDDFRVPADPTAYRLSSPRTSVNGPAIRLGRRTQATDQRAVDELRSAVLLTSLIAAVEAALSESRITELPASFTIREV